jgi:hypothetical protein
MRIRVKPEHSGTSLVLGVLLERCRESQRVIPRAIHQELTASQAQSSLKEALMRTLRTAAVTTAILAAAVAAADPASATVIRFIDSSVNVVTCATHTYTITGDAAIVIHQSVDRKGRTHLTGTVTTVGQIATDESGAVYSLSGAQWFGFNGTEAGGVDSFTNHINIVAAGQGTVDSVSVQAHISPDGKSIVHDRSTCLGQS